MAQLCTCDPKRIDLDKCDILLSNIHIVFYKDTGKALAADIYRLMNQFKLGWGPIHHIKILNGDDPNAATRAGFLRMCDTSTHLDVIKELDGWTWPLESHHKIGARFNRQYSKMHQVLGAERYAFKDAACQTNIYGMIIRPEIVCDGLLDFGEFKVPSKNGIVTIKDIQAANVAMAKGVGDDVIEEEELYMSANHGVNYVKLL